MAQLNWCSSGNIAPANQVSSRCYRVLKRKSARALKLKKLTLTIGATLKLLTHPAFILNCVPTTTKNLITKSIMRLCLFSSSPTRALMTAWAIIFANLRLSRIAAKIWCWLSIKWIGRLRAIRPNSRKLSPMTCKKLSCH